MEFASLQDHIRRVGFQVNRRELLCLFDDLIASNQDRSAAHGRYPGFQMSRFRMGPRPCRRASR